METKSLLKNHFETGKFPTQEQFAALIDSLQALLVAGVNISFSQNPDGTVAISADFSNVIEDIQDIVGNFIKTDDKHLSLEYDDVNNKLIIKGNNLMDYKGFKDASANPNWPAGKTGDFWLVVNSGKIGGSAGRAVSDSTVFFCIGENIGGNEATVGSFWKIITANITPQSIMSTIGANINSGKHVSASYDAGTGKITVTAPSNFQYKGAIDPTTNPNWPTAIVGDLYNITAAGLMGGIGGRRVYPENFIYCIGDSASGTEASVGVYWKICGVPGKAQIQEQLSSAVNAGDHTVPFYDSVTSTFKINAPGVLQYKAGQNCSTNPNYPAAFAGDFYRVTGAGKIGGASGKEVEINGIYYCLADNAGGTEAAVGSSWSLIGGNPTVEGVWINKGDINCSTNPNYPAGLVGDTYYVTAAGKIGGASGVVVEVGDEIRCKVDNAGGTEAAVGTSWFVIDGNKDQATESTSGYAKIATQANTNAGADDEKYVTPLKLLIALQTAFNIFRFKGNISCSGNPNYPSGKVGDWYHATSSGKIGGASGKVIYIAGAVFYCIADNAGGNEAAVGASWAIVGANVGASAEGLSGLIILATQAEVNAGTDDAKAITALKLKNAITEAYSVFRFKGNTDTSGNPNYPVGKVGDWYRVSVSGKIGGASGKAVTTNAVFYCISNNAGGNEATVGTSWAIITGGDSIKHNPNASTDPGTGDDSGDDYSILSTWANTSENPAKLWICRKATNPADWVQMIFS